MEILVLLADGCEEVEALTVVDLLRRANISVCMASVSNSKKIIGSHGIEFYADELFQNVILKDFSGVFLPGGLPGTHTLRHNSDVIQVIRDLYKKGLLVSAICAAPVVLEKAGILTGKSVTCYPGFETMITEGTVISKKVVVDGNIITGQSVGTAFEFGVQLIVYLKGEQAGQEIREQCLFKENER